MKALSELWNKPLIRCPFAVLICQYAYREGDALSHKPKCIASKTFQTCEKIQDEVIGKRPQDVRG